MNRDEVINEVLKKKELAERFDNKDKKTPVMRLAKDEFSEIEDLVITSRNYCSKDTPAYSVYLYGVRLELGN